MGAAHVFGGGISIMSWGRLERHWDKMSGYETSFDAKLKL